MGRIGWLLVVTGGAVVATGLAFLATGGAAVAAVGGAVGGATPATPGLPAGPYTNLGKAAKYIAGHTYLTSAPLMAGENLSSVTTAFQSVGYKVLGSWTTPPAGWPSDETLTSGAFVAITAAGAIQATGSDVTTWAVGGASA